MYGDYLARISAFISVLLILISFSLALRRRRQYAVGSTK